MSITLLGTTLGRARCPQAAQLARMRQSLVTHGQLTPVIAVEREGVLELVDGFKRLLAARQMGWGELFVSVRSLDERGQWTAMLTLNRVTGSLSVLEEGLIVRELCASGMTQVEIAQMVGRHKSWVSRRLGLVDRLHPELLEWVRTGLMSAGTARRLMVLPAGNQVELAAVVSKTELSTEETEILVSLWQKTTDPAVRRFLMTEPRTAIENARPEKVVVPPDPRLSERGRNLLRTLQILRSVSLRVTETLHATPMASRPRGAPLPELALLERDIHLTAQVLPGTLEALGFAAKWLRSTGSDGSNATPTYGGSLPRAAQ